MVKKRSSKPIAAGAATETAAAPPGPPPSWWVVEATALLASVAAANLISSGRPGPVVQGAAAALPADAERLALDAVLRLSAADGSERLVLPDLRLARAQHSERQTVWTGYDGLRRVQVIWVWDFYRIQSHAVIRVGIPAGPQAPDPAWAAALAAVRALAPGDTIAFEVAEGTPPLQQPHTVRAPARPWTPER